MSDKEKLIEELEKEIENLKQEIKNKRILLYDLLNQLEDIEDDDTTYLED